MMTGVKCVGLTALALGLAAIALPTTRERKKS